MANAITPNIGIELPTPGVTGGLGVEPSGQSWLELLNTGFSKVDSHDHAAAGGAPLNQDAIVVDAAFAFNGFDAIGLRSTRYVSHTGVLAGADDDACVYFVNGDLYVNNGSGVAVRITNGTSVSGAAGNITGLSGGAAVTWSSGLGVFIFEQVAGVKAGLYTGPISIFDPVVSGKKVTVSVPSGLAADYALVLPAALPASKKVLFLSAAGEITAEDVSVAVAVDGTSLVSVDGILSVKDLGISTGKLAASAVSTAKIADGAVTRAKQASVGLVRSTSSGNAAGQGAGDIPNASLNIVTSGRPVVLSLESDGTGGAVYATGISTGPVEVSIQFQRSPHGAGTWTTVAILHFNSGFGDGVSPTVGVALPCSAFAHTDSAAAGDWDYKAIVGGADGTDTVVYPRYLKLVAYEL